MQEMGEWIVSCDNDLLRLQYNAQEDLSIHTIHIDAKTKKITQQEVSLSPDSVSPSKDASLLTAKTVLDHNLGIYRLLLLFETEDQLELYTLSPTISSSLSAKNKLYTVTLVTAVAAPMFDIPVDEDVSRSTRLQSAKLLDGPFVVLSGPNPRQISIYGMDHGSFTLVRENVELRVDRERIKDKQVRLEDSRLVSSTASDNPHLLLHFVLSSNSDNSNEHLWRVFSLSNTSDTLMTCSYLPQSNEQTHIVVDCMPYRQLSYSSFEPTAMYNPSIIYADWYNTASNTGLRVDLSSSTLQFIATTSQTIAAYRSDILLASVVLPAPINLMEVVEDTAADGQEGCILAAKGTGESKSFFLLNFRSSSTNYTFTILEEFKNVGSFYVGNCTPSQPTFYNQILLLNDSDATNECRSLKRSVLMSRQSQSKYSCIRLRLDKAVQSRKRKAQPENGCAESGLKYVERVKRKKKETLVNEEGDGALQHAPQEQVTRFVQSLEKRLEDGIEQLQRLDLVASDKEKMVAQRKTLVEESFVQVISNCSSASSLLSVDTGVSIKSDDSNLVPLVKAKYQDKQIQEETVASIMNVRTEIFSSKVVMWDPVSNLLKMEVAVRNKSEKALCGAHVAVSMGDKTCVKNVSAIVATMKPMEVTTFFIQAEVLAMEKLVGLDKSIQASVWLRWNSLKSMSEDIDMVDVSEEPGSVCIGTSKLSLADMTNKSSIEMHADVIYPEREELLLVAASSNLAYFLPTFSLPPYLRTNVHVDTKFVRPLSAILTVSSTSSSYLALLRNALQTQLPEDVIVTSNPLQPDHLSSLLDLLHSLQKEMECIQLLSNESQRQNEEDEKTKIEWDQKVRSFLDIGRQTDLDAVRVLAHLEAKAANQTTLLK